MIGTPGERRRQETPGARGTPRGNGVAVAAFRGCWTTTTAGQFALRFLLGTMARRLPTLTATTRRRRRRRPFLSPAPRRSSTDKPHGGAAACCRFAESEILWQIVALVGEPWIASRK